MRGTWKNKS